MVCLFQISGWHINFNSSLHGSYVFISSLLLWPVLQLSEFCYPVATWFYLLVSFSGCHVHSIPQQDCREKDCGAICSFIWRPLSLAFICIRTWYVVMLWQQLTLLLNWRNVLEPSMCTSYILYENSWVFCICGFRLAPFNQLWEWNSPMVWRVIFCFLSL